MKNNNRIGIFLGHPAHFHLYKNVAKQLKENGYIVDFLVKRKDILEKLLQNAGLDYIIVREEERKVTSKIGLMWSILTLEWQMFKYMFCKKPRLVTGTYIALCNKILKVPMLVCNEDDADVVPRFAMLSYPGASAILNPIVCNSGKWNEKAIKYNSYQELAYLHPNHFTPRKEVVEQYFSVDKPYMIMRFAKLTAHHDSDIQGITLEIAKKLIDIISPQMDIYITSERELESELEPYRIKINPLHMHDVMAFASLYVGDSQTMAAEAGVLGVPFVRFNDFVGRIGYLRELEDVYNLGYGIRTNEVEKLYKVVENLVFMSNRHEVFGERRKKMLSEKIDYAKFLTWFIENYPESAKIMKDNPNYQYKIS